MSRIAGCRSCGSTLLESLLDLGAQPLANALLAPADLDRDEPRYPLELVFCPACALVQITETVPPEQLFGQYLYFSSYSDSFVAHARELAERLVVERGLGPGSLVVEAASNDGYLLQHYRARGVPVLGLEPAANVAEVARGRGVATRTAFFGVELAEQLVAEGLRADVFHAHNVLAHVPDPHGFLAGVARLLAPGGLAVIEVPDVHEMVRRLAFDTIYHEHLCYFSLNALLPLCERHGLVVVGLEELPVHGGSLRLLLAQAETTRPAASVDARLARELWWGLDRQHFFADFAARVQAQRASLRERLDQMAGLGLRLAGYGAAAKATVLLNYVDPPPGRIAFVADRSPHKQGRLIPGVRVPIRPPEALLDEQPDVVLLLAWNLRDEVLDQQAEYRRRGGRFLVPLPELELL